MILTYRPNRSGDRQAAYCGAVRIGYIDRTAPDRWIWSLNTIQPEGGRAADIVTTEEAAKRALAEALVDWLDAAGLQFKPD